MSWYYAEGSEQRGPLTEEEFQQLIQAGRVADSTLVWQDGMAGWEPYGKVRGAERSSSDEAGAAIGMAGAGAAAGESSREPPVMVACTECGGSFPNDEVISYGDRRVCASCKPGFLQRMKEGVLSASPGVVPMVYGGFWIRFVAKIVDGVVTNIIVLPFAFLLGFGWGAGSGGGINSEEDLAISLVGQAIGFAVSAAYVIFFLGRFGATPGKMMLGLKVVTDAGEPISYGRATGRWFAEILSSLICLIGYIIAAFDQEKRTLHDHLASTRVIRIR